MFGLFTSKTTSHQTTHLISKNFSISILLESKAGLLFVALKVEKKTYKLLLDTAAFTLLSSELLTALKGQKTDTSVQTIDAFGACKETPLYTIPYLDINGVVFHNSSVICDEFLKTFPLSCLELDGILGYNLFSNLIVELNYEKKELILSDKLRNTDTFSASKLLITQSGVPAFSMSIGKNIFEVALDTGKNDGLMIGDKKLLDFCLENELQAQRTTGVYSSSFSGLNQHSFIDTFLIQNFTIAKKINIDSFTVSYQKNAQNIAGNDFLKNFHIIIDFRKKRVYFKKRNEKIQEDFLTSFGFISFWSEEKRLYISAIIEGSSAYHSKLKIGDRILSINDLDTLNFSQKDYCEFSLLAKTSIFESTKSIKLSIKRETNLLQVVLDL